jgi:hypothetical protein
MGKTFGSKPYEQNYQKQIWEKNSVAKLVKQNFLTKNL